MERKEFWNIESMSNNIRHSSRESPSNANLAMSVDVGSFIISSGVGGWRLKETRDSKLEMVLRYNGRWEVATR